MRLNFWSQANEIGVLDRPKNSHNFHTISHFFSCFRENMNVSLTYLRGVHGTFHVFSHGFHTIHGTARKFHRDFTQFSHCLHVPPHRPACPRSTALKAGFVKNNVNFLGRGTGVGGTTPPSQQRKIEGVIAQNSNNCTVCEISVENSSRVEIRVIFVKNRRINVQNVCKTPHICMKRVCR